MVPIDQLLARATTHRLQTGRPLVSLSYAQSLDGSLAARRGSPLLLSGKASMQLTHRLRASHDAILVGIGTILADDPQLTVRLVQGPQPQPVILDSHLRLPPNARVFQGPKLPWIGKLPGDFSFGGANWRVYVPLGTSLLLSLLLTLLLTLLRKK